MNRVYAAVRVAGLNPYPGFLHSIDYGRFSLVLDLMEEFRPIIVDTLTLSLFNLKILKKDDFYAEKPSEDQMEEDDPNRVADVTKDPIGLISGEASERVVFDLPEQRMDDAQAAPVASAKYPVKLHHDPFRRVIDAFEKKLTTAFYYPPAERQLTYGDALIFQAQHYRKAIEVEADRYQPILLK